MVKTFDVEVYGLVSRAAVGCLRLWLDVEVYRLMSRAAVGCLGLRFGV